MGARCDYLAPIFNPKLNNGQTALMDEPDEKIGAASAAVHSEARLMLLGRRPYREVWELQRSIHTAVADGTAPDTWIFVEHDPVITLGRNAKPENVKLTAASLAARNIDCVKIERGGDATYHGPGQLVVYPILRLARFREVVPLVRKLEGVAIDLCAKFGVQAERWSEHAGVWVGDRQICAIGLAVQKMASLHGIALNISTDLSYDQLITPCGLVDRGVTSLQRECGTAPTFMDVIDAMRSIVEQSFRCTLVEKA